MPYLLLLLSSVASSMNGVSMKQFQKKTERVDNANHVFNFGIAVLALVYYAVTSIFTDGLALTPAVFFYALLYAVGYVFGTLGCLFALPRGSLLITNVMCHMGCLIPILYGLVFCGEMPTPFIIVGMLLLLSAIVLFNMKKVEKGAKKKKGGLAFWIFAFMGAIGNGVAMLAVRVQQNEAAGEKRSALLFYGILFAAIMFLFILCIYRPRFKERVAEGEKCLPILLSGIPWIAVYAFGNATANFIASIVVSLLPAIVQYMLSTGIGIMISFLVGRFIYREKLTVAQYIGVSAAAVGLVLLTAF